MSKKLSAIIITKNEEERIGECLKSVDFADDIIVVDNGSIDKTVNIVKKFGARVVKKPGDSFNELRNKGAEEAKGEWLLYIDADERVMPSLREEIKSKIPAFAPPSPKWLRRSSEASAGRQNPKSKFVAYAIPRKNILLGKEMKYGGWWPDYVMRLMRKEALKGWKGELHEQPEIKGRVGKLKNPLTHNTHRNLTEMVDKTNEWSEIEAKLMFEVGHPPMNIPRFFTAMFRELWYRAIVKKGFLDGPIGIIEIVYQMFSRFISYAKLWEMQIKK